MSGPPSDETPSPLMTQIGHWVAATESRLFAISHSPPRRKVLGFRHCTSLFFGGTCCGASSSPFSPARRQRGRLRRERSRRRVYRIGVLLLGNADAESLSWLADRQGDRMNGHDYRLWHETDMPMQSQHVRCWGINGRGWDVARSLKMTPEGDIRRITRARPPAIIRRHGRGTREAALC
jgi:hypothetical protein